MKHIEDIGKIIALIAAPLAFLKFFLDKNDKGTYVLTETAIYIVLTYYLIVLFFSFKQVLFRHFRRFKLFLGLDVIIEHQKTHLEFMDPLGKEVVFFEEYQFKTIKQKKGYYGALEVDGVISDFVDVFNCHASLENNKKEVEIVYGDWDRQKEEKLLQDNQKYFSYSLVLKNSFMENREHWKVHCRNYTKVSEVVLSFLPENPPVNAKIIEILSDKDKKLHKKPLTISPIIYKKYGRIIMKVKLLELKKGKVYVIEWDWKTPLKEDT